MKVSAQLALRQSLTLTHEMRQAIDMLAMTAVEIDGVIDEELLNNPLLEEAEHYRPLHEINEFFGDRVTAFDVALNTYSPIVDFREELMRQIGEGNFNVIEREIADHIVNNLNDDGLLLNHFDVYEDIIDKLGVFIEWIESVRKRIMDLDPLGCGACSSGESLIHQAKKVCQSPHQEFISLLQELQHDPALKLSLSRLGCMKADQAIVELRKLSARPSTGHHEKNAIINAIVPEVVVQRQPNGFDVSLSKKPSERIVIRANDFTMQNSYFRKNRKRALFIKKALHYREASLTLVSRAIVDYQQIWLKNCGPLKPLNLREIANVCGLHESSVSRLTRGKYLQCDKGIFELKYFFSGKIVNDADQAQSAISVKGQILNIIGKEDKKNPLSDQKIVEKLREDGLLLSRRTVTKYRESLALPSAYMRRALF